MKTITRELFLCLTLTAFVFVCALTLGSPFLSAGSTSGSAFARQQTESALFSGTVVRNGEQFLLRDASGQSFLLADTEQAEFFEGKAVTVTGRLDAQRTIHVERIDSPAV